MPDRRAGLAGERASGRVQESLMRSETKDRSHKLITCILPI